MTLFRIQPEGPPQAYRTFSIRTPLATHTRQATCAEVGCAAYEHGWVTIVDETEPNGAAIASYIRHQAHRAYREDHTTTGTRFTFEPGQKCFAASEHRISLDRPEIFITRDGDWRGNPTGRTRRHARAEDWVEDFALNQINLAERMARG